MNVLVEKEGYLRFLKSCIPSIVVTYWKPVSMSFMASSGVFAILLTLLHSYVNGNLPQITLCEFPVR
jgi:hypothetical protein